MDDTEGASYAIRVRQMWAWQREDEAATSRDPKMLRALAEGASTRVAMELARNSSTPVSMLDDLADDVRMVGRTSVASAVAGNHFTSPETLHRLASSTNTMIRCDDQLLVCLTVHEYATVETKELARLLLTTPIKDRVGPPVSIALEEPDPANQVGSMTARGREIAASTSGDPELLRGLCSRASVRVAHKLARNPATPPDVLDYLAGDRREVNHSMVGRGVAENPSTHDATLLDMAVEGDDSIRNLVRTHPNASSETKAVAALIGPEKRRNR